MRVLSSWGLWTALAAATADLVVAQQTTLIADPATGTFGLCYDSNCANSLSISLYKIMVNTNIDYTTNEVLSSTVLSDFSVLDPADLNDDGIDDAMITRTDNGSTTDWQSGTLYARACITAHCNPRPSNETEFQDLLLGREDAVGIKLVIERESEANSGIVSTYESYDIARGALRLNLSVAISPLADQPDALPMFGISFLVAALENHSPTVITSSSTAVDNHMYLERVTFGSDMFLDLPRYVTINGADTMLYTAVKGQTSGDLKDLVMVTLMFGPVVNSIEYAAAVSSLALSSGNYATPAPSSTAAPVVGSDGNTLPTQLSTKPRGNFGMCLSSDCSTGGTLSMGFSGLEIQGSSPLKLTRFANSPAFLFGNPSPLTIGGEVVALMSSFEATVPQSAIRPPKLGLGLGEPTFVATVGQFISGISVPYGDHIIDVPRGAVKFSVALQGWVLASGDVLTLSMPISLVNNNGSLGSVAAAYSYRVTGDTNVLTLEGIGAIDFPTYAIADGVEVPVTIQFDTLDANETTLIVTLMFQSFTQSLFYDPIMKSIDMIPVTPSPAPPTTWAPPTPSWAPTTTTPMPTLILDKPKRQVGSWGVAGFLLGFLAFVIVVSIIKCYKRAPVKLDFSKIIP